HAEFDVYSEDIPKYISKEITLKNKEGALENAVKRFGKIKEIFAIVAVSPRAAGLEQKKPYVFEASVSGGDIQKQFTHVKELLGKEIKIDQIFEIGSTVDVAAITKGKGWQGVIQRWGVKKKQHKSRKTVREVGSLGPISPQSVMYTVPRAGQMGFHQRTEYDKRIMIMGNTNDDQIKINPDGGYKHFGLVKGDFIVLKGSVPGTYRRLIKLRRQIRNAPPKVNKPNILEVVV
ncbi:MAG: 50S ribosomal protein L3, partial [Nitrosopumilus sp.]